MSKTKKKPTYEQLVEQETLIFEATELIAELLEKQELTKKELAERLGCSKGFVTQLLAGDRNMTLRTLADLAYALEHRVEVRSAPLEAAENGGEDDSAKGDSDAPRLVTIGTHGMRTRGCVAAQCSGSANEKRLFRGHYGDGKIGGVLMVAGTWKQPQRRAADRETEVESVVG